jgi:molybdopterin molybdotransferase
MISAQEAWQCIAERIEVLPGEQRGRQEAAGGVLTETVLATVDVPFDDVSAMDGYALAGDLASAPVVATIAAGDPGGATLKPGQAARIMTGAIVPAGADRVVPVEHTDGASHRVQVMETPVSGAHIRRRGEVLQNGEPLLESGALLTPAGLGLLATHGIGEVNVHRRPTVAILPTGDEVVAPEETPSAGQLRDSHSDFLSAAVSQTHSLPTPLGIAPDEPDRLSEMISRGLESDVLLICGGVSMGEFDFVEAALERAHCDVLVNGVAIQPGKPLVVARHPGGWVFGLPGNPASAMIGFWLFVRPLLNRLAGRADAFWSGARVGTLENEVRPARGRDLYLPAQIRGGSEGLVVRASESHGSHDVAAYAHGTALLRVPANSAPQPGDSVEILAFALPIAPA